MLGFPLHICFFIIYNILLVWIFAIKLKYYRIYKGREIIGIPEILLSFVFLYFPILGKDNNDELDVLKRKINSRLMLFYGVVLLHIVLVVILNYIR